ncbi:RNA polymerase factor sigma-54 [Peptostreptococcus canis]|uniref:RNA polymerase factor sigma-54 n=1 Tax=Peptostreptococcus canis TaxID=1159213 RepID=UPI002FE6E276
MYSLSFKNKIQQVQSQKLIMTTNLVQSLKILNMSRMELEEEIEVESMTNPLLDVTIEKNEINWEKYLKDAKDSYIYDKNEFAYRDNSEYDFENMTKSIDSLYDSLYGQINIMYMEPKYKIISNYIIDSLDKDGYLREKTEDIAKELNEDVDIVNLCLDIVQQLEPAGIGARNIQECMLIQLKREGIEDPVIEKIIEKDLNLVANLDYKRLSSKYHVKKNVIENYIDRIKALNPKPVQLSNEEIVYTYPDIIVEFDGKKYVAKPYNDKKISMNINQFYRDLMLNTNDESVKSYIRERLNSAKQFINEVNERNSTIVRIANVILEIQEDYFKNNGDLKPMSLVDIADKLDFHPSTVSRGVNGKYMLTSKGLLEFKYFFSTSFKKCDGEVISTNSIKDEIKKIIENEDKRKPLSDSKIESILKTRGYDIARRTIAKYREEIGYLSSSMRKEV